MSDPTENGAPRPMPLWMQIFGWYGTVAIVGAYAALSHGWLQEGPLYQLLNATGAAGVGLVCWRRAAWQALAMEVVWVAIAITALV